MALIDEYKQAIQDVLDGRAKEPPRPSELPWTEDKAATMWAAAAAELIAEDRAGGGGGGGSGLPDTPGTDGTYALQNTVESGTGAVSWVKPLVVTVTNGVMSSTFGEISDAFLSCRPVIASIEFSGESNYSLRANIVSVLTSEAGEDSNTYRVLFANDDGTISGYTTFSRDGYPEYEF